MINSSQIEQLVSGDGVVHDNAGKKIGKVGTIYLDDQTGEPEWVSVKTGLLGSSETLVPLAQADVSGHEVRIPYDQDKVKGAPHIGDGDDHISEEQEAELYRYYGMGYGDQGSRSGFATGQDTRSSAEVGQVRDQGAGFDGDTGGAGSDEVITLHEERLHVGTERVETGRVRLRKYVTTEQQQVTVPVSHQEVRVEREPITDASRVATGNIGIGEEQHEVTLTAERPVVAKEHAVVEEVHVGTQTVTEQQEVQATLATEHVEVERDGTDQTRR